MTDFLTQHVCGEHCPFRNLPSDLHDAATTADEAMTNAFELVALFTHPAAPKRLSARKKADRVISMLEAAQDFRAKEELLFPAVESEVINAADGTFTLDDLHHASAHHAAFWFASVARSEVCHHINEELSNDEMPSVMDVESKLQNITKMLKQCRLSLIVAESYPSVSIIEDIDATIVGFGGVLDSVRAAIHREAHKAAHSREKLRAQSMPVWQPTLPEQNITIAKLKEWTTLGNDALAKYRRDAGVTVPARGKKNHVYSWDEAVKILRAVENRCVESSVIKRCADVRNQLQKMRK